MHNCTNEIRKLNSRDRIYISSETKLGFKLVKREENIKKNVRMSRGAEKNFMLNEI